jgi:hypothetical protein
MLPPAGVLGVQKNLLLSSFALLQIAFAHGKAYAFSHG